jgi:uridine kinase
MISGCPVGTNAVPKSFCVGRLGHLAFEFPPRNMQEFFDLQIMDSAKFLTYSRIVIDGDSLGGKTTLAKEMADKRGFKIISFDSYLAGDHRRPYLEQLNYEALRNDILASTRKIIFEGICALKILAKINVQFDCHIFVMLFTDGRWKFEDYIGEGSDLPSYLFDREIAQYYRDYRPHEICNFITHNYQTFAP